MSFKVLAASLVVLFLVGCKEEESKPSLLDLTPLVSNHMVLQQESTVKLWGKAEKGIAVTASGSWGKTTESVADSEGYWEVQLETPPAGGPFELEISDTDSTIILTDVMSGDVWLASGQSNMEMPVKGWLPGDPILGSEDAIANSTNSNIRMFTVPRAFSASPESDYSGTWEVADPETSPDFSATAFFFAQKVQEETGIPIGIIHSSWGGTVAEAWTKPEFLDTVDGFQTIEEDLRNSVALQEEYTTWLDSLKSVDVTNTDDSERFKAIDLGDAELGKSTINTKNWAKMNIPASWENRGLPNFDGAVWFKKTFELPKNWQNKALFLELGPIDDMDATYVNGQEVGRTESLGAFNTPRNYTIPAAVNNSDSLHIAFRVLDTGGGGGANGDPESMKLILQNTLSKPMELAGDWDYLPVADYKNGVFYQIGTTPEDFARRPDIKMPQNQNTPTFLYNAMIAPIENYNIKGAIWYQGESNVGRADQYATLFPQMIRSWRDSWGADFPFYFVQLAPYVYSGDDNSESAELRDAQRKSTSVPNTGMAVTLDVGDARNIHPANKRAVGERLARWALAKTYNQDIVPSGPEVKSATFANNKITLQFELHGSKLLPSRLTGFEGAKEDGEFFPIRGIMEGDDRVLLSHSDIETVKTVRYAFQNVPKNALIKNEEGLPASSFELVVQ